LPLKLEPRSTIEEYLYKIK